MPLSNKDLSDIAKEFAVAKADQADDKAAIPNIEEAVTKKQDQATRIYILYNNAQVERVQPYETEHRWMDGTTYSPITQSQIETVGEDGRSAYFFPVSWAKSNAKLQPNGNGNPKTTSINSESASLSSNIENGGLITQIDLLVNGQSSSRPSDNLDSAYSPGATSIQVEDTGHTNGNYLYIAGSGTSALVKITGVAGTTLSILEIIPPASTIGIGGSVVENIPGFSNSERNTLTSGSYQRILTELTNRITSAATFANTAMDNQLVQLNLNIDAAAQITAAKTSINTAKPYYTTWLGLSNTGASGKFVNTSLNNFAVGYTPRVAGFAARAAQITAALGSVTQDVEGNYSGVGLYLQRYKCMNFLINTSNGPLFQITSLNAAKLTFQQKVANTADKLATFSNLVRYSAFTADSNSSSLITVENATQFQAADSVLLTGNDLPSIQCSIVSVASPTIVLSISVPKEYTKAAKAGIIKQI
jgi:hypothetical protein